VFANALGDLPLDKVVFDHAKVLENYM